MTGIIICDECHRPFFAHGKRENIPPSISDLKGIPFFKGVRHIFAENQTNGTISKFYDVCEECE